MKHIPVFDGLRGILALWVVLFHVFTISGHFVHPAIDGQHAVTVFFALSGFVIAKLAFERREHCIVFITRRFFRLFPVYAVCLIIASFFLFLGVMPTTFKVEQALPHTISHISMLHGLVPPIILPDAEKAILNPAWSVSVEWQFYILAPILFSILIKWPTAGLVFLLGISGIAKRIIVPASHLGGATFFANAPFFTLGIVSYFVWTWIEKHHVSLKGGHLPLVIAMPLLPIPFLAVAQNMGLFVWLFVFGIAIHHSFNGNSLVVARISNFLSSRALVWLGAISYPLYLVHEPFVWLFVAHGRNYLPGITDVGFVFIAGAAVIVVSLFFSQMLSDFIEKPAIAFGKRATAPK